MMNAKELTQAIQNEENKARQWANDCEILNWSGYRTGKLDSREATYALHTLVANIEKLLDREGTAFDITLETEDSERAHRYAMNYVHGTRNVKNFKEYAHRIARVYLNWGNAIEG